MPTDIKLKNSVTATNAPTSLQQGEVAINITDKKVWVGNAATTPVLLLGSGADGTFTNLTVSGVASFADGTVSLPSITNIGDTNTGIFFPAADTIAFSEGGVESMRIDSSGNVGIGNNSPLGKLKVTVGDVAPAASGNMNTGVIYESSVGARAINFGVNNTAGYSWINAAFSNNSATADNLVLMTGTTERMRITSAGDVGIGTSSPSYKLQVSATAATVGITSTTAGQTPFLILNNTADSSNSYIFCPNKQLGIVQADTSASSIVYFSTQNTERMRIEAGGNVLINKSASSGTTNGFEFSASTNNTLYVTSDNDTTVLYRKTSNTGFGILLTKSDVGGTDTLVGAGYANGTFAAVSDQTKKKNIESARNYLDDIMKLRVVKYNWNTDEESSPKELGWIAQEVEQVFPAMVSEIQGSKLLKKEIFLPMLMKAIQELKAELDSVKAELQTLKGK